MSLRGDYHNLAVFFDKVARLSRIVNINNITVTPGQRWAGTQHRLHRGHLQVRGAAAGKTGRTGRQTGPGPAAPAKPGSGQQKKNTKLDF